MKRKLYIYIIVFLIILLILLAIISIINNINDNQDGKIETEEAYEYPDSMQNSTEIYDLNYPMIAFYAYDVINQLQYNAYSIDVMLAILDEEYISYYNITRENINDYIDQYINKEYVINTITCASTYDNSLYVIFVNCEDNAQFIIKYSATTNKYKLYLDNYLEDYGYDNFINNNLKNILDNSYVQGNKYNYIEPKINDDEYINEYFDMLSKYDFNYIYENIFDDNTKNIYSYDKLLNIYNDENSFFKNNNLYSISSVFNDNGFKTYSFTDSLLKKYNIIENKYFDFKISIKE